MFPQRNRLRHDKDIKTLFAKGKSVFSVLCGLKYKKNNLVNSRFAVVIGTKISKKAVVRNRLRRQIRAIIQEQLMDISSGYDVVVLVRPEILKKTKEELKGCILEIFKKALLLK